MPIQKRTILDLNTGIEYKSISEAAKALDITPQAVCYQAKPQRFKYMDEQ